MNKRNKPKRFTAVMLTGFMLATMFPVFSFAADATLNGTPEKEMEVNKQIYYDVYDGATTGRADTSNQDKFFKDAIKNKGLLNNWAKLARSIYEATPRSFYTGQKDKNNKDFSKYFDGGSKSFMDLVDLLADTNAKSGSSNSNKNDKYRSTGLQVAGNLKQVETEAGKLLQTTLGRKLKAADFVKRSPVKALHDEHKQPVLYTMAASFDKDGGTAKHYYNCFGIAFYDFKLTMLIDDKAFDTPYNSGGKTYSLEEAIQKEGEIPNFSVTKSTKAPESMYITNHDFTQMTAEQKTGTTSTTTVSSSIMNSEKYEYGETFDFDVSVGKKLGGKAGVETEFSFGLGFSALQAFETAITEEKSYSQTDTSEVGAAIVVPAHAVAAVKTDSGESKLETAYDCPVGITYRAVIFSLNGECYDDNVYTQAFDTADYYQYSFYTVFGNDYSKNNTHAVNDLYDRVVNVDTVNEKELTRGNTLCQEFHKESVKKTKADRLDWSAIESAGGETSAKSIIKNMAEKLPMSVTGGVFTETVNSVSVKVSETEPLYPLAIVQPEYPKMRYDLEVGDTVRADTIRLEALDKDYVPYYGFIQRKGKWEALGKDGNTLDPNIAVMKYDASSDHYDLIANGGGSGYMAYRIPEKTYSYHGATNSKGEKIYVTNDSVKILHIPFTIAEPEIIPFDGTVEVEGNIVLTVGDEPKNLNDITTVTISDKRGKEIEGTVTWEAKETASKGIQVSGDEISVTKDGTFHVCAVYEGVYSDWIEVTALPAEEVIEIPDFKELTRGDLALILYDLIGREGIDGETGFKDIDKSDIGSGKYYKQAVSWACQNGILNGYSKDDFGTHDKVTKEQFVTVAKRFADYLGVDTEAPEVTPEQKAKIDESKVSTWAKEAVEWAVASGKLNPDNLADIKNPINLNDIEEIVVPVAEEVGIDTEIALSDEEKESSETGEEVNTDPNKNTDGVDPSDPNNNTDTSDKTDTTDNTDSDGSNTDS